MTTFLNRRAFGGFAVAFAGLTLSGCVGTAYYPGAAPPQAEPQRYPIPADVLFGFGSATLRPEASRALAETLARIRAAVQYPAILVEGHTDSIGSDAANDALSLRRAEAVRQWLIQAGGIPPSVINVQGIGERRPVAPNTLPNGADNPAGRAQNRRVELLARPA